MPEHSPTSATFSARPPFLSSTHARAALALAAALLGAGCASTPPTRFHTLMPAQPSARTTAGTGSATAVAVVLEPIRIPAQVDQPQWLVRLPDESMQMLEQERWASPLQDELRQAILEELGARFGIVDAPAGTRAPLRLRLELRRLESIPGREARIDGAWVITPGDAAAPVQRCEWRLREAAGAGMPALASAHRRAVVRLAGALGESVLKLSRGEAAACPATLDPS
jgi:uncharacterized lipoprotein YmbA